VADAELGLRVVLANNPGPFTLDGTRTHLLGDDRVAVIDPGPSDPTHLESIARAVASASSVTITLTHGHPDHADGATDLSEMLGAPIRGYGPGAAPFREGERVDTDAGDLVPIVTPGHTRHHYAFHWPQGDAVFAGDLVLGVGDTTWVAEYPGCVADYLTSLEDLATLEVGRIFPAHGPPIGDVAGTLARYRAHRLDRIRQVREARVQRPSAGPEELLQVVYGRDLPAGVLAAALESLRAILYHLEQETG